MSVLALVSNDQEAEPITRWGCRFAQALSTRLIVLCVVGRPDAAPRKESSEELASLEQAVMQAVVNVRRETSAQKAEPGTKAENETVSPEASEIPAVDIERLDRKGLDRKVVEVIAEQKAQCLLVGKYEKSRENDATLTLTNSLFSKAPCATILVRPGESESQKCSRILVPACGGPHSKAALELANDLRKSAQCEMTVLYVQSDGSDEALGVGERRLGGVLRSVGLHDEPEVEGRVVLANDVRSGITKVAEEGHDLLLVGASNVGMIRRTLFGTVPDRLLSGEDGMTVAVVRGGWSLIDRIKARVERWLNLTIPQLERTDRVALYERLEVGSKWNFDFMMLIALSTSIAAVGLLQDSAAVVIGAMLVAPLMSPLLGAGLALVQENLPFVLSAVRAIVSGFLFALLIGWIFGTIVPLAQLTPELAARGGPTILDLLIAFLSGVAAAHCTGRPNLSAALPGVAIAAALVPPIATTGIALAINEMEVARGAAILFGTNVVAIILGAAASFYAGGVRAKRESNAQRRWVKLALLSLVLIVAALSVPLASLLVSQPRRTAQPPEVSQSLRGGVEQFLKSEKPRRLLGLRHFYENGKEVVEVRLSAPNPPNQAWVQRLSKVVRAHASEAAVVRVKTELATEVILEGR